ncbi:MAG: hypothetical protein ACFFCD_18250 [Promethearchaeota archaeon]
MKQKTKNKELFDLHRVAVERLSTLDKSSDGVIKFHDVFIKLCTSFQLPKKRVWKLLDRLKSERAIEMVPYQGVRVLGEY